MVEGSVTTRGTGNRVSITKAQETAYKKKVTEFTALKKAHNELSKNFVALQKEFDEYKEINNDAAMENAKDGIIAKLTAENSNLKVQLEQLNKALRATGGKSVATKKELLNSDLVAHVEVATKNFLFRTWKILECDTDEVEATTQVIPYLTVPLPANLTQEQFVADYKCIVTSSLGDARAYVQSEGKKRAKGTSNNYFVYEISTVF